MNPARRLSSLLFCVLMLCMLPGCSWMPSLSIPFWGGDDTKEQASQAQPAKNEAPAPKASVSPEVRSLVDEARKLWTPSEECLDPEKALTLLDKAIELDPLDPSPYLLRSRALSDLGYLSEAFEDATKAIRLHPTAESYATRGLVCLKQNQPKGAKNDFDYAMKLDANEPLIYIYRSAGAFLEGKNKDACEDLERACELGLCLPWERTKKEKVCR
ncbi:MAG: hypothetical protein IJ034_04545 [Mailhella sp.]|nr:hypothetical protein [Mailhella sp.]